VIGHAIDAVETRRLIAEEAVIELQLRNSDPGAPLVEAAAQCECQLVLESVIPETNVACLAVENASVKTVTEEFANVSTGDVRLIREDEMGDRGVLEWSVPGDSLLGRLANHGANVTGVTADRNAATYTVELASDAGVRTLLERVQHSFPETRLDAKREVNRPYEPADKITGQRVEKLTERQQDVMETAFRAGYYQWPRDSTAEEIAEILGIAAPTLHARLRKAENQLLGHLFDTDSRRVREVRPAREQSDCRVAVDANTSEDPGRRGITLGWRVRRQTFTRLRCRFRYRVTQRSTRPETWNPKRVINSYSFRSFES
jgi:predicted DNA binding protein